MQEASKEGGGAVWSNVEGDAVRIDSMDPCYAGFESCSSQRSRRTASCSSGRHRQALHAALMLPSPCQPGADAGHSQELARAGAADAAWQDTEAGEGGQATGGCAVLGVAAPCSVRPLRAVQLV